MMFFSVSKKVRKLNIVYFEIIKKSNVPLKFTLQEYNGAGWVDTMNSVIIPPRKIKLGKNKFEFNYTPTSKSNNGWREIRFKINEHYPLSN